MQSCNFFFLSPLPISPSICCAHVPAARALTLMSDPAGRASIDAPSTRSHAPHGHEPCLSQRPPPPPASSLATSDRRNEIDQLPPLANSADRAGQQPELSSVAFNSRADAATAIIHWQPAGRERARGSSYPQTKLPPRTCAKGDYPTLSSLRPPNLSSSLSSDPAPAPRARACCLYTSPRRRAQAQPQRTDPPSGQG